MASSSSGTPMPFLASVNRIGTTCASSIALSNGVVQRLVVRLLAAEVLLHQVLVHLDDLVEDGGVAALDRVEVALALVVEQALDDRLAAAGGQVDRQALRAERLAGSVSTSAFEVDVRHVALVDDDRPRQVAVLGGLHHPAGDDLDAARAR